MKRTITFFVYFLAVVAAFLVVVFIFIQTPVSAMLALLSSGFAYLVIAAYRRCDYSLLRYAAAYFALIAILSALILISFGGLLFLLLTAAAAFGCYALGFSPEARRLAPALASSEFAHAEACCEYKGFQIRKSKNYYWIGDFWFSSMKEAEAFVEDRLGS